MMDTARKLFALLDRREKRNLLLLFVAVLIMAVLEVVSVAAILPFLSVAADPASIQENAYLLWTYETFGFDSVNQFLVFLGLGAFVALVVSNAFISFATWLKFRYVFIRQHTLSKRLLERYLRHPYEFFVLRNSSDLTKNILSEVQEVTRELLQPAIMGFARGMVVLFIIGFLIAINPLLALIVAITLGGAYGVIYIVVRRRLSRTGRERVEANQARYTAVSEAFGSIKDIKLMGKEASFLNQYVRPSATYAKRYASMKAIAYVPRYALEAIAFGGIILIAVYLIGTQGNFQQIIPMLGLYAFAGYRLMPAMQKAFTAVAQSKFNSNALDVLYNDLVVVDGKDQTPWQSGDAEPIHLKKRLELRDVIFTYAGSERPALRRINMEIQANATVGIVGTTGSGKTTLVDVVLGLLQPNEGELHVDDKRIEMHNVRAWQQCLGYVPQDIVLTDTTIARNIAFGMVEGDINIDAVESAASAAQIHEYIEHELPNGYDTVVGERGVRLSGGQRQRIGIARALYHNPSVLVLDEATSALDNSTEESVMQAIKSLGGSRTIIIIAHRLSTVKNAQTIFVLSGGQVAESGTYGELMAESGRFRRLASSFDSAYFAR